MWGYICGHMRYGVPIRKYKAVQLMKTSLIDKEIEIVHELGQQVLKREDMLNAASDVCGELDRYAQEPQKVRGSIDRSSLLALAQGARMYKFSRPHITESNVIDIKAGR